MADEKCTLVTEVVGNRPRRGLLPSSYTGAYGEGGVTKNISDQYLKYRTCSNSTWPILYNRRRYRSWCECYPYTSSCNQDITPPSENLASAPATYQLKSIEYRLQQGSACSYTGLSPGLGAPVYVLPVTGPHVQHCKPGKYAVICDLPLCTLDIGL